MAPKKGGKKKPPAHSDFTKTRSSLKAKQAATPKNATSTAFKARSIVLPNQRTVTDIEQRKQTKLTDDKGRGIEELVTILRGVGSGGTGNHKAEALDSLSVLCARVPDRTTLGLGLLPTVLPLIPSDSASIRSALHRFMSTFLKHTPHDALVPYSEMMTLWTMSGMNHLRKEVREDAAKLGELIIDVMGDELVRGWQWVRGSGEGLTNGQRFYVTLLTALGVDEGSASKSANIHSDLSSSPVSKLRVLSCLEKLIRHQAGLQEEGQGGEGSEDHSVTPTFPTWIFRSCLQNPSDWEAFVGESHSAHTAVSIQGAGTRAEIAPFTANKALVEKGLPGAYTFADVAYGAGVGCEDDQLVKVLSQRWTAHDEDGPSTSTQGQQNPYLQLYNSLHSTLLHTLLDHAPSVLGPEGVRAQQDTPLGLRLIDVVLRLTRTLFRATLRSINEQQSSGGGGATIPRDALKGLSTLLDRSGVYFPFERRASRGDYRVSSTLRRLSAGWCELVGIQRMLSSGEGDKKRKGKQEETQRSHLQAVEEYLIQVLQEGTSSNAQVIFSQETTAQMQLSDAEYLALIPTVWHLLSESETSTSSLFTSFITHWSRTKITASSHIKSLGFKFLSSTSSLIHYASLSPTTRKLLTRPTSPIHRALRDEFITSSLGRYIYELGSAASRNPSAVEALHEAWRWILDSLRFDSPLFADHDVLVRVLPTLQPFFWIAKTGTAGPAKRILAKNERIREVVSAFVRYVSEELGEEQKEVVEFTRAVEAAGVL